MPKLTEEQMKKGRERFLAGHADACAVDDGLSQREADILGIQLEDHRNIKTMELLRTHARSIGAPADELFWSLCFDSTEEFNAFLAENRAAIQRAIGLS